MVKNLNSLHGCGICTSGCWDEDVLQVILKYLVVGNSEIRQDLILSMIDGKNVQYVNKVTSQLHTDRKYLLYEINTSHTIMLVVQTKL